MREISMFGGDNGRLSRELDAASGRFLLAAGLFQSGACLCHAIRHRNALRHVQTLAHGVEKLLCLNQLEKSGLQTSNVIARQNGLGLNLTVGPAQSKAWL